MWHWLKRIGIALLALVVLAGGAAVWKREEIGRLMAVNSLFAPEKIVANFSNASFQYSMPSRTQRR